MRGTLIEVLGAERGSSLYTFEWLNNRVRFHLDPKQCEGGVFLALDENGECIGHTIVRMEGSGQGLFATLYVVPGARRTGVGESLVVVGEAWFRDHGATSVTTHTHPDNAPLIRLFARRGYRLSPVNEDFVSLRKEAG